MRAHNPNRSLCIAWSLATLSYCFLIIPQRAIPIYGDDFLLLRASGIYQGFGSSAELAFGQTGMSKYRPVFLIIYALLNEAFGENLGAYLIVNSFVSLLLGISLGFLLRELTELKRFALPIGIIVVSSMRFLWSSREWIWGLMEILALMFCIISIYFFMQGVKNTTSTSHMIFGNIFLLLSVLTAERYIYVGFIVSLYFAYRKRGMKSFMRAATVSMPAVIVLLVISIKVLVLRINPIQGSLVDYQNSKSTEVLSGTMMAFGESFKMISGFSSYGLGNTNATMLRLICLTLMILFLVLAVKSLWVRQPLSHKKEQNELVKENESHSQLVIGLILGGIGILVFEPYVQERFMALTQILVLILLINLAPRILVKITPMFASTSIILLFLLIEWSYLPARMTYNPMQTRIVSLTQSLNPFLIGSEPWSLMLEIPQSLQNDMGWALGYPTDNFVGIFTLSKNPPQSIDAPKRDGLRCVVATISEENLGTTVRLC